MLPGDLDNDFLLDIGGTESNSLTNILQSDIDKYQPQIISHSLYYDHDTLAPILSKSKYSVKFMRDSHAPQVTLYFKEYNLVIKYGLPLKLELIGSTDACPPKITVPCVYLNKL